MEHLMHNATSAAIWANSDFLTGEPSANVGRTPIPADRINLDFVLGNKLVVGTVNANREYFEAGVYDFARAQLEFPGWLPQLLTHPVTGLENYQEMMQTLTMERSAIKVFVTVAQD
jgi:hypothetical protein